MATELNVYTGPGIMHASQVVGLGVLTFGIVPVLALTEPARASQAAVRGIDTELAVRHVEYGEAGATAAELAAWHVAERFQGDLTALTAFRPGYPFWQHVFLIPDGNVVYGSAEDGRLLATFPARGDWTRSGRWEDASLEGALRGQRLPAGLTQRRQHVAELLQPSAGRVVHNATRGLFLLPNARRYGSFLEEWGAIYERFGVPAELGLAQAVVESGLNGTVRSEARAIGFCQWLEGNWNKLKRLAHRVIEGHNQTTQAAYCAAYLTVLATKYGSYIPALSEHHAGGTNVGRTVVKGAWLGGGDVRERYFLGSELARDLRDLAPRQYRDIYHTYGPRSFRYAEMVFGNMATVASLRENTRQARIHAMQVPRAIPIEEVTRRTGLSVDEVRRYNPALIRRVPAGASLYLPVHVDAFGPDVAFWHRPPTPEFSAVLNDFLQLQAPLEAWDEPAFQVVLREFQRRFRQTDTEEGHIMTTVLAYVMEEAATSGRGAILSEFRTSERIQRLFEQAVADRERNFGAVAVSRRD